jgi:amino acid transporter
MIRIFEFLFYCLYRMFALIKRQGEKDERLASMFLSVLLSTYSIMFFYFLRLVDIKSFLKYQWVSILLRVSFILVFIVWYFVCKNYFIYSERHNSIISFYLKEYPSREKQFALFGILFSLFTFILFYLVSIYLANGTIG